MSLYNKDCDNNEFLDEDLQEDDNFEYTKSLEEIISSYLFDD